MELREEQDVLIFEKQADSFLEFISKVNNQSIALDKNVVLVVNESIDENNVSVFESFASKIKQNNQSIVIVAPTTIGEEEQSIAIVPTVQEALDFIQMEEIERDLGF